MTAAVAILDADTAQAVNRSTARHRITPGALAYLTYLAGKTDAEGLTHVTRERAAQELGYHIRTITRWRAELETAGLIVREEGGHRGMSTVIRVITRATRALVRRAHAARWTMRREIRAAQRWRHRGKGDTNRTPTTPPRGGTSPGWSPPASGHAYEPDEWGEYCARCDLPASNQRHRTPAAA